MITKAKKEDVKTIYELWKECFSHDDGGYTNFYFQHYYNSDETFVKRINGVVIGCASKHPHEVVVNGRVLQMSMICGIAIHPEYRKQGNMERLMRVMLEEAERQELMTMIQAYDPRLYLKYGFEPAYEQHVWKLTRESIPKIKTSVQVSFNVDDCLRLYADFVSRFDGYYIRDKEYFNKYAMEVYAQGGKFIQVFEHGELTGYAVVYYRNENIEVEECIYLNADALHQLMEFCIELYPSVLLVTSAAENIDLVFPGITYEERIYTMVRLNDAELFNRLYNCNIKNATEALAISGKPLFMHESR